MTDGGREMLRKMSERVLHAQDEGRFHDVPVGLMNTVWATLEAKRCLSEYLTRWQRARRVAAAGAPGSARPAEDDAP